MRGLEGDGLESAKENRNGGTGDTVKGKEEDLAQG